MRSDRTILDENDLLQHSNVELKVYHSRETVWIGDIRGDNPSSALVTVGFKNLRLVGEIDVVLDRLRAMVQLLERAQLEVKDWDLLLPRRHRAGSTGPRTWAHPFRDPAVGPPDPTVVEHLEPRPAPGS